MPTATEPGQGVSLPIVYTRASAWFAAFPCPLAPLAALLPDRDLHPIQLWPGMGSLVVAVFDYQETSIGPYGEVGLGIPCRYRASTAVPLLPLLAERWLDDVGYWLVQLPVTTAAADEAGRAIWGYPKYVAGIDIEPSHDRMVCTVSEGERRVLRVEIDRPGESRPMKLPLRTYSRLDDDLHLTEIDIDALGKIRKVGAAASLELDDHPRNASLGALPRAFHRPVEVRWFDEYRIALDRARARYRIRA